MCQFEGFHVSRSCQGGAVVRSWFCSLWPIAAVNGTVFHNFRQTPDERRRRKHTTATQTDTAYIVAPDQVVEHTSKQPNGAQDPILECPSGVQNTSTLKSSCSDLDAGRRVTAMHHGMLRRPPKQHDDQKFDDALETHDIGRLERPFQAVICTPAESWVPMAEPSSFHVAVQRQQQMNVSLCNRTRNNGPDQLRVCNRRCFCLRCPAVSSCTRSMDGAWKATLKIPTSDQTRPNLIGYP